MTRGQEAPLGFRNQERLLAWEDAILRLWWGWNLAAGGLYTLKESEAKGASMTFRYEEKEGEEKGKNYRIYRFIHFCHLVGFGFILTQKQAHFWISLCVSKISF